MATNKLFSPTSQHGQNRQPSPRPRDHSLVYTTEVKYVIATPPSWITGQINNNKSPSDFPPQGALGFTQPLFPPTGAHKQPLSPLHVERKLHGATTGTTAARQRCSLALRGDSTFAGCAGRSSHGLEAQAGKCFTGGARCTHSCPSRTDKLLWPPVPPAKHPCRPQFSPCAQISTASSRPATAVTSAGVTGRRVRERLPLCASSFCGPQAIARTRSEQGQMSQMGRGSTHVEVREGTL